MNQRPGEAADPIIDEQKEMKQFKKHITPPTIMAVPFLAFNNYDKLFLMLYMAISVALLGYKHQIYPLPGYAVASQGVILAMLLLTQLLRYVLAQRAVSDKQSQMVVVYLVASVFVILSYVFQLRLQTYVVMAEVIINWVGLALVIAQFCCGIWVAVVLKHKKRR